MAPQEALLLSNHFQPEFASGPSQNGDRQVGNGVGYSSKGQNEFPVSSLVVLSFFAGEAEGQLVRIPFIVGLDWWWLGGGFQPTLYKNQGG